jgi:hypothetical protein
MVNQLKKHLSFLNLSEELLPYLNKKYRVAPFKMIAGHDTTAGFLNFYLLKENPLLMLTFLSPELAPWNG